MIYSDVHWTTKSCRAKLFLLMLRLTSKNQVFAIGDMFDGERTEEGDDFNNPEGHLQGQAQMLRDAAAGTDTTYGPGNHDTKVRKFLKRFLGADGLPDPNKFFGIKVADTGRFEDALGNFFDWLHGDQKDSELFGKSKTAIYKFGSDLYDRLVNWDERIHDVEFPWLGKTIQNWVENRLDEVSLASFGKRMVKGIINRVLRVRHRMLEDIRRNEVCKGAVWGHSHDAEIFETPEGKFLLNPGSSTQDSAQCLVFDDEGNKAALYFYKNRLIAVDALGQSLTLTYQELGFKDSVYPPLPIEDIHTHNARRIERVAYRLWAPKNRREAAQIVRDAEEQASKLGLAADEICLAEPKRRSPPAALKKKTKALVKWTEREQERVEDIKALSRQILSRTTAYLPETFGPRRPPDPPVVEDSVGFLQLVA
jgi:UDP-2,3-diacylglucosamine pyrophosphatase LpxH